MALERTVSTISSRPRRLSLSLPESYDLLLLSAFALLLPALTLLPIPLLRIPLGLVAALGAPGYALTAALFADRADLDGGARAALSFGLSVAVLPMIALVLNALPWGIRPEPIAVSLSLWILSLSGVALWRRRTMMPGVVYVPPAVDPLGWWRGLSARRKQWSALGALACISALIGSAFILLMPDPAGRMTEFYALGSEGLAGNYPRELALGEPVQVSLGISNHEGVLARYRIEARADGQLLAQTGPLTLGDGATWSDVLRFTPARAGDDQRIAIFLYRDDDAQPYRQLWLWVNVRP